MGAINRHDNRPFPFFLKPHLNDVRAAVTRGIACGWSIRQIARRVQRVASTVSREVIRHGDRNQYRANEADHLAWELTLRPKPCFLAFA